MHIYNNLWLLLFILIILLFVRGNQCSCVQQQQTQQPMYYPLGNVQTYQQQPQPAAQLNGVVQHDEILQNLTPSNNNVAVNNVNNSTGGKCFLLVCERDSLIYFDRFIFPSLARFHIIIIIRCVCVCAFNPTHIYFSFPFY